jgi:hypothetical protein
MNEWQKEELNPHNICSWKTDTDCENCNEKEDLNCRFSGAKLLQFYLLCLPFAVPAFMGIIQSGYSSYLLGWVIMAVVFFGFWEIYILCSHCPFYALNEGGLVCIANFGCPNFFRYQPGPISKSKKIQLIIGFIIMCGYPFIFMILGHQYQLFFISIFGLLFFWGGLFKFRCTKCVNFSCVFNRVPKNTVDSYLKKNPMMAKAWEDAGWQIDHTENS